jgi:hypothetical protein
MPSTMPLRVGDDLLASARLAADATGRSAAQQIGYWAKLGRELERSGSVSVREVAEVLAGARSYDDLDPKAQAGVRAEWDARTDARREALNLAEVFTAEGRSWVEAGSDGAPIRHPARAEIAVPHHRPPAGTGRKDAPPRKASQSGRKADPGHSRQPVRATRAVGEAATLSETSSGQTRAKKTPVKKASVQKKKASTRAR